MVPNMRDKPTAKPEVTEWIDCSWTVYVNEPAAELPIEFGVRSDLPQFTVTGLDPTFLGQACTILLGKTEFEVARECQSSPDAIEDRAQQIASAIVVPNELTVQVSAFSEKMCRLLASVDEQRAADIARRWHALLRPSVYQDGDEPDAHLNALTRF
jgi:hypothetical protein